MCANDAARPPSSGSFPSWVGYLRFCSVLFGLQCEGSERFARYSFNLTSSAPDAPAPAETNETRNRSRSGSEAELDDNPHSMSKRDILKHEKVSSRFCLLICCREEPKWR